MAEERKDEAAADTDAVEGEESKESEKEIEAKESEVKIAEQEARADEAEAAAVGEAEDETEVAPQQSISFADLNFLQEMRSDVPVLKTGDVVQVSYRVIEGGKERIQVFEGTVIAIKNTGITKTITVRKTSFGIAVERIFPLNSSLVQKIEVKKHSRVRRAKLYYLRNLKGKAARLKELR